MKYSPSDLQQKFQERTTVLASQKKELFLKLVDQKITDYVEHSHPNPKVGGSTESTIYIDSGNEDKQIINEAVNDLIALGFNAKYEFNSGCDDGPGRSSPDRWGVRIDIAKPLIPTGPIKR